MTGLIYLFLQLLVQSLLTGLIIVAAARFGLIPILVYRHQDDLKKKKNDYK